MRREEGRRGKKEEGKRERVGWKGRDRGEEGGEEGRRRWCNPTRLVGLWEVSPGSPAHSLTALAPRGYAKSCPVHVGYVPD